MAATDDGHVGKGGGFLAILDGSWAASDQAARDDYFYRAPHVVSLASKRIIAAYYGSPPTRSYFDGCSTGGREGLLLAQRYPHDFNGIAAGAPAAFMGPLNGVYFTWMVRVNTDAHGAPILTSAKLPRCTTPSWRLVIGWTGSPTARSTTRRGARSTRPASSARPAPTTRAA